MASRIYWILTCFFLWTSYVHSEVEENQSTIRFSGIPALGIGADTGFGAGVVGSMYVDHKDFDPYKMALGVKIFLTTKGINSHALQLDQVSAFGLPLRLITRIGFYSSLAQNYCGRASDAFCSQEEASRAASKQELNVKGREEFIDQFYRFRYMSLFGDIFARWLLWKDIAKLELMLSYRGKYYWERDFSSKGPYPGSLYEKDFRGQKSDGYLSQVELGLMLDKRNYEAFPTKGYWLEGSVRGASSLIGSAWDYFATNLALRFYVPLDEGQRLVIASQTIADVMWGDLPYDAMSRIGGSMALYDYTAFGGQNLGRGIKEQLYVGRIKAIQQAEFRYLFYSFLAFKQNFDLSLTTFGDFGMTAWDFSRFTKDMSNIYSSFGAGLRLHWNKTFIVRADLGVSPIDNFSPGFYLVVGNVF